MLLRLLRPPAEEAPDVGMALEEDLVKAFREERLTLDDGLETAAKESGIHDELRVRDLPGARLAF
jgi:hypothetical protein